MNTPVENNEVPQGKSSRARDPEFWIAIGALIVSAIAMLTSLLQVNLQRSQERALVWPHVSARTTYSPEGFSFKAFNKGLGPALVRDVQIHVDGKPVADWPAVISILLPGEKNYGWDKIRVYELDQTILAPNDSVTLFQIGWDEKTSKAFSNDRISAHICYCSFLDECWISRKGLDHERIDTCPNNKPKMVIDAN